MDDPTATPVTPIPDPVCDTVPDAETAQSPELPDLTEYWKVIDLETYCAAHAGEDCDVWEPSDWVIASGEMTDSGPEDLATDASVGTTLRGHQYDALIEQACAREIPVADVLHGILSAAHDRADLFAPVRAIERYLLQEGGVQTLIRDGMISVGPDDAEFQECQAVRAAYYGHGGLLVLDDVVAGPMRVYRHPSRQEAPWPRPRILPLNLSFPTSCGICESKILEFPPLFLAHDAALVCYGCVRRYDLALYRATYTTVGDEGRERLLDAPSTNPF